MRTFVSCGLYLLGLLLITLLCYPLSTLKDIVVYELSFCLFGLIFTIILNKKRILYFIILILTMPIIKSFIYFGIIRGELKDPWALQLGIPVDIALTAAGLLLGFVFAKLVLVLCNY